ncbi:MAG: hypothetical protein ACOCVG_01525 [Verrucomicrobiota bacterium]
MAISIDPSSTGRFDNTKLSERSSLKRSSSTRAPLAVDREIEAFRRFGNDSAALQDRISFLQAREGALDQARSGVQAYASDETDADGLRASLAAVAEGRFNGQPLFDSGGNSIADHVRELMADPPGRRSMLRDLETELMRASQTNATAESNVRAAIPQREESAATAASLRELLQDFDNRQLHAPVRASSIVNLLA